MMSDRMQRYFFCHSCDSSSLIDINYLYCPLCNSDFLEERSMNDSEASIPKEHDIPSESDSEITEAFSAFPRFGFSPNNVFRNIRRDNRPFDLFSGIRVIRHHQFFGDDSSDEINDDHLGNIFLDRPRNAPTTEDAIERINVITIDKSLTNNDCKICGEFFKIGDKCQELGCLHAYHLDCLKPWLKINDKCPICRKKIE